MAKPKWTKGPWFATNVEYPDGPPHERIDHDLLTWTVSTDPGCAGWCHDGGYPGYGVSEADARLMAAAPQLYEALEAAEDHLADDLNNTALHPVGDCPVLREVRAALAKARGEAV